MKRQQQKLTTDQGVDEKGKNKNKNNKKKYWLSTNNCEILNNHLLCMLQMYLTCRLSIISFHYDAHACFINWIYIPTVHYIHIYIHWNLCMQWFFWLSVHLPVTLFAVIAALHKIYLSLFLSFFSCVFLNLISLFLLTSQRT